MLHQLAVDVVDERIPLGSVEVCARVIGFAVRGRVDAPAGLLLVRVGELETVPRMSVEVDADIFVPHSGDHVAYEVTIDAVVWQLPFQHLLARPEGHHFGVPGSKDDVLYPCDCKIVRELARIKVVGESVRVINNDPVVVHSEARHEVNEETVLEVRNVDHSVWCLQLCLGAPH